MHLKRFSGRALPDVLRQVRDELGPEAVILHTKPTGRRGVLRLFRPGGVEILAAVDRREVLAAEAPDRAPRPAPPAGDDWRTELGEIRRLVARLAGPEVVPEAVAPLFRRLVTAGVEAGLARRLVEGLAGPPGGAGPGAEALAAALAERIEGVLRFAGAPLARRSGTVALVGPPGAGKTTTLAKLAAHAHVARAAVSLVSLEEGCLGGPGPLDAFAAILGVPHAVAPESDRLGRVSRPGPTPELVLVDTPGLDPRDGSRFGHLARLLETARPAEVHLVIPATSKPEDALAAVRGFAGLGVTHLVVTRLDGTATAGTVLELGLAAGVPLSYLGTGREVPHDIRPASAGELTHRILQGVHRP